MKNKLFASALVFGMLFMCLTSVTAEARSFFSVNIGGLVAAPPPPPVYVVEQYYPAYVYAPGPYCGPARIIPGGAYAREVVVYPRPVVRPASFSWGFGFGR